VPTGGWALDGAGLRAASIIPELERWLPELRAMAEAQGAVEA
jgi:hypothetical protein